MALLVSLRVLFFAIVLLDPSHGLKKLDSIQQKYEDNCNMLTREPYFEPEMVVGKPWRIYYTWNMKLEDKCMDMVFKTASQKIVNRIYNDMVDYLEAQPNWNAATLLITMGNAHHEMLLFADQGAAGRFVGVPNVVRDGNISPNKNSVPLFRIYMKLILDGKYLVMSDCNVGVSTMSGRKDQMLYKAEIAGIANNLGLGDGYPSCFTDYNTEEKVDVGEK